MTTPQSGITRAQLIANGLTPAEIEARLRAGLLRRVRRGVYCTSEELSPREVHRRMITATLPLVDTSSVVTHQSAAVLHGLPLPDVPGSVLMTRRTNGHGDRSEAMRVRHTVLDDDEVTFIDGIPVTTLARTASDLARLLPYEWGVAVCDAALHVGLPKELLRAAVTRHRKLRGNPKARMATQFADGRAESPAESRSRVQIARAGLPEPVPQYEIYDSNGVFVARTDFGWPAYRLVGEVDGKWKYGDLLKPGQSPQDAIMQEKRREEAIRQAGFWPVRWDVPALERYGEVPRLVQRALELQRKSFTAA
ncbi:MAG: hypothetical protein QM713_12135 [Arachnia sp.]